MNIETRASAQNRKRSRQSELNQSVPRILPKVRRTEILVDRMSNPKQPTDPQIVDMSRTINQPSQVGSGDAGSGQGVVREGEATPNVHEMVSREDQKSLEEKVRELVQLEMSDIKRSIDGLIKSVAYLTRVSSQEGNTVIPNSSESDSGNATRASESSQTGARANMGLGCQDSPNIDAQNERTLLPVQNGRYPILNHQSLELSRIRVDKLGISFDGNPAHININDFVFRLEHLQRHYQIPWEEVLRDFHLLMTGSAREWYWLFIKTHGIVDWPGLRHALLAQYQTTRSNFEIMRDLVERKQQSSESVDSYFHAMCQIRSRLIQPIPEYDLIKIIKRNIRESIGRIVYPIAVSSVEQLRVECNEAERNFPRRDIRAGQPVLKQNKYVNEVYEDSDEYCGNNMENNQQEEHYEEVCAATVNTLQRKQTLVCWNCKQPGHVYMDCTSMERNLFCYKCGRPNVITPKCPNCQSGNQTRSLSSTGNPSATGNQTPRIN